VATTNGDTLGGTPMNFLLVCTLVHLKRQLRVLGFVVKLNRLSVRGTRLADWALELCVTTLSSQAIRLAGLTATLVGRRIGNLALDFRGGMLSRLGLPAHVFST
jgi:hypothetical protein